MSFPTRVELEGLKRAALQSKCKELGIKANSKSEMLIDMILGHYQATAGPSTSNKRKAQDEGKPRRVKAKVEPEESVLPVSPKRLVRSPPKPRARGKGKAKAMTPVADVVSTVVPQAGPALAAQPLSAYPTSATIIDTTVETSVTDSRMVDLELQIRNARKAGDESTREVSALKAFQNAIQQAFGDENSSDTLASMGQLAQLRDVAPRLVALAAVDTDALSSRVEAVQRKAAEFEVAHEKNQTEIAELQERLRELETGMPAVLDLEASVRQLQSQFNRIPASVFNNNRPEDLVDDNRYTIIRPASTAPVAGPSNSQQPSSQFTVLQEGTFPSENQNQNTGRATSVARSLRGSRQPLAEKEKEPEVEDVRRSTQTQSRTSSQSSRGRSAEPYSRGRTSEPPTPSRKGKGRQLQTQLDTVNEEETSVLPVADPFTPTHELTRSPPAAARNSASPPSPVSRPGIASSFLPPLPNINTNGPIAELPFKLIASSSKPSSSEATSRSSAPTGRVARTHTKRTHAPSVRCPTSSQETVSQPFFSFALPGASAPSKNGTTSTSSAPKDHGFISPERFGFFPPQAVNLGCTPGGLAFKTTGRAAPGTPVVTNTMYGTEVARDNRFADLPYPLDAGVSSWD
ncbi:unnamed protein product [Rhizoctonia solani]|nr:unnamed protein product [Rhizoctonia solani]